MRRIVILSATLIAVIIAAVTAAALWHSSPRAAAEPVTPLRGRADALATARLLATPLDHFGLALLRQEAQATTGNVVISPLSIHDVLSMILNGAQGQTAIEMRHALDLGSQPLSAVNQSWANLITTSQVGSKPALEIANSLWLKNGVPFRQSFLATNCDYFAATLRPLPSDPVTAASAINSWVSQRTAGLIRQIVSPDYFDAQTILALVNTVHVKTTWTTPFAAAATAPAPFTLASGAAVAVPTMHGQLMAPVAQTATCDAVALQTKGSLTVWVIVPKGAQTPASLLTAFAQRGFASLYRAAKPQSIMLALPRFRTSFSAPNLKSALAALGMPRAFSPDQAQLQGIVAAGTAGRVYIQRVVHKAVLNVNENGIEAAAATAGIVGLTSGAYAPVTIRVDRPFLMVLSDKSSGAALFMALIRDPRQ
jgi:serpin B